MAVTFFTIKSKLKNNKLVNDSFWSLLGNTIGKGLGLISGIFIARLLGSDIYGEYGIIRNTLTSSAIFATFGLGYTATKYIAENKKSNPNLIALILKYCNLITIGVSGFIAILLFIYADYFASHVLDAPHLKMPLRITAIYIVFNAIDTTQIGIISGFGAYREMSKVNTIVGIFTFITTVLLAYFFDLNGVLIALVLAQIFNWYLNNAIIKKYSKEYQDYKDTNREIFFDILKFSLPVALQEGIYSVTSFGINFIMIFFSDYKELGIYSAAIQWYIMILFVPGILRNVILSHLSEITNDNKKYYKVLNTVLLFNFIVTLIPFLLVFFLSDFIASFYGASFDGIQNIISIVVCTAIFASMSNVYNQAYLSFSKNWFILISRFIRDFGIMFSCYLLFKFKVDMRGALIISWSNLILNIIYFVLISINFTVNIKKNN